MVSREKLQQQHQVESSSTGANDADNDLVSESGGGPPTAESERLHPPTAGNPTFYRTVPPFDWHKKWGGTSWTWGPEAGHRGWSIAELKTETADDSGNYNDDDDDWHGRAPVEVWNLRLPGGIFVQTARVIQSNVAEACRLAWLPDSDTLLRLEARVLALQPIFETSNDDDGELVGFEPPVLASMRCDVLQNLGDLEGAPSFVQQMQEEIKDEVQTNGETGTTKSAIVLPSATEKIGDHSPKRHK